MFKANVSEIHLCQRCPRLLAYKLIGKKNVWNIGFTDHNYLPGKMFHDQISMPFFSELASRPDSTISQQFKNILPEPEEDTEIVLLTLIKKEYFIPLMKKESRHLTTNQIFLFGQGLIKWTKLLARFIHNAYRKQEENKDDFIKKTFHKPEMLIKEIYNHDGVDKLQVSGKYDSLLFDMFNKEAVLMEFKGRKADFHDEDFLQVVLYCWLVYRKTGIIPRGIVLYLEEEEPDVHYSTENIKNAMENLPDLFEQVIKIKEVIENNKKENLLPPPDPELCKVCRFESKCQEDWGDFDIQTKIQNGKSEQTEIDKTKDPIPNIKCHNDLETNENIETNEEKYDETEEAEKGMELLLKTFDSLKLPVNPNGYIIGPRFIRYKLKPQLNKGVTCDKLKKHSENLQVELGLSYPPMIMAQPGYVSIDTPRKTRIPLTLGEVMKKPKQNSPESKTSFPLGMAIDGSVVWADFSDPTMSSILVGGSSGSGKSVFLRSAVVSLALRTKPQELKIVLIDPKRVSFNDLSILPHLFDSIIMDEEAALDKLTLILEKMEERYLLFEKEGVCDLNGHNKKAKPLCRYILIIDEYADLIIDKNSREKLEVIVQRLGQKGRAAGFHLILATQRPDAKVVTPIIKANLQLKVALKVTTGRNSSVILDQPGAECLIGHGDMMVGGSVPVQRLQCPIVTKTEIEKAMREKD